MGKITDITEQKKLKHRVSLYVDGTFRCGLDTLTVKRHNIEIGDEIEDETLVELQRESDGARAFERAVKYATARPRTKREIKTYLKEKGYLPEMIAEVTAKLNEYGFIDDFRYARDYVAAYVKKLGVKRIKMDLKARGVCTEAIDAATEDVEDQREEAFAAAEKYIRTHSRFDIHKLKNYLYTRGFASSDISYAAERVADEYDLNGDDDEL